jgi:hypothetical protein
MKRVFLSIFQELYKGAANRRRGVEPFVAGAIIAACTYFNLATIRQISGSPLPSTNQAVFIALVYTVLLGFIFEISLPTKKVMNLEFSDKEKSMARWIIILYFITTITTSVIAAIYK